MVRVQEVEEDSLIHSRIKGSLGEVGAEDSQLTGPVEPHHCPLPQGLV